MADVIKASGLVGIAVKQHVKRTMIMRIDTSVIGCMDHYVSHYSSNDRFFYKLNIQVQLCLFQMCLASASIHTECMVVPCI